MPVTMSTSGDDEEFYDPPSSPLSDDDPPQQGVARGMGRTSPPLLTPNGTPDNGSNPGFGDLSGDSGSDERAKTSGTNSDILTSCSDDDDGITGKYVAADGTQIDSADGAENDPIETTRKGSVDGDSDIAEVNITKNTERTCDATDTSNDSQNCDLVSQVAGNVNLESMSPQNIEPNTANGDSPNVAIDTRLAANSDTIESKSPTQSNARSSLDPVSPRDIDSHPLSDPEADTDLDALVQMQDGHDVTNASNIDILAQDLSDYSKSGTEDGNNSLRSELPNDTREASSDSSKESGSDDRLEDVTTRPHTSAFIARACDSESAKGGATQSQACTDSDNPTPITSLKTGERATIADTKDIVDVFSSDTNECSQEQMSIGLRVHADTNNKDFDSPKSSTCGPSVGDLNDHEHTSDYQSHNGQHENTEDTQKKVGGLEERSGPPTPKIDYDESCTTKDSVDQEIVDSTNKTDHNANLKIAEVAAVSTVNDESFPTEFLVKMAALGTKSKSLDKLPETSSLTLGSLSPTSSDAKQPKLQRRDTFPFASSAAESAEQARTVKVVRLSSVDGVSTESKALISSSKQTPMDASHPATRRRSRTDPNADKTAPTKESITAVRKSLLVDNDPKNQDKKQTDKTDSPFRSMSDNIDSKTVLKLLDNLERHLEHEKRLRERAEDWADFLTSELEAHIDARTTSEKRYTAMRERFLAYKETISAKYKRLVTDHKALVIQIRELTLDDGKSTDEKPSPKLNTSSSLLRRNRSQTDRTAIMTKRNAVLIRGSRREPSSDEEEGSDSGENQGTGNRAPGEKLPNSIADVKSDWQKSLQERRAASKKAESTPVRKSPLKAERTQVKQTQASPVKTGTSPVKADHSLAKAETSPKSTEPTLPKSEFTRHGSFRLSSRSNGRRSSSTSHSDQEIKPETSKVVSSSPPDKSKISPEKLKIPSSNHERTSTPLSNDARSKTAHKVNGRHSGPNSDEKEDDGPVDVRKFTNMWEKKIAEVPFKAQTSTATPRLSLRTSDRTSERSSSFSSIPASPVSPTEPNQPLSRPNGDDTFELDDDDDLEYLSAQEDDLDDSAFKKSEGVLSESINTQKARNLFQNIANASTNTPKSEPPKMKLSYSASAREARSKFMKTESVDSASAPPSQRTRARAKTLTEGVPKMDNIDGATPNGSANHNSGSERSAKFSTLMSRWQLKNGK